MKRNDLNYVRAILYIKLVVSFLKQIQILIIPMHGYVMSNLAMVSSVQQSSTFFCSCTSGTFIKCTGNCTAEHFCFVFWPTPVLLNKRPAVYSHNSQSV